MNSKMTVEDLKGLLLTYGIDESSIAGTGKEGRVVKGDIVDAIKVYEADNGIVAQKAVKATTVATTTSKPKSNTAGLKTGDRVLYDDGENRFEAEVVDVTASTKASIRALSYVNDVYNPSVTTNSNRKFMTTIHGSSPKKVVLNLNNSGNPSLITLTLRQGNTIKTFNIKDNDFDRVYVNLIDSLNKNNIPYEK